MLQLPKSNILPFDCLNRRESILAVDDIEGPRQVAIRMLIRLKYHVRLWAGVYVQKPYLLKKTGLAIRDELMKPQP